MTQGGPGQGADGPAGYETVDAGYFEQRKLRRYAGVGSLWALGVGR